jgi:cytochrome P450
MPSPDAMAAVEFNPLLPAYIENPHPFLRQLREYDPVHWSRVYQVWVLTRYADALLALRDARLSASSSGWQNRNKFFYRGRSEAAPPPIEVYRHWMLQMDPPDHTRRRALLNKAFTSRMAEAMRPRIQNIVDRLLDVASVGEGMDIITALAYPLPIRVICDLIGIPEKDQERVKRWSHELLPSFGPVMSADQLRQVSETMTAFSEYFEELIQSRKACRERHLLDSLIEAQDAGGRLSERELVSTCILLIFAGHLTTVQLIAEGVLALLCHPQQAERLRSDPRLIASAVDEVLRFDGPLQVVNRTATEDLELGGKTIRKGQMVLVSLVGANRDPEQFPEPDCFDIGRTPNRHIAFGYDCHYCAGAPLARLEAQIALETLLRRFPRVGLPNEPVQRERHLLLRGIKGFKVRFDADAARR